MRVSGWLNALSDRFAKRNTSARISRRRRSRRSAPVGADVETLERRTLLSSIVVNSFLDSVDAAPGDGIARDSAGRTTLRAAVMEANARAGADTIILGAGTYGLTLAGINENGARTGDLDITDATGSLTIQGAGVGSTFIDANELDRVLEIFPGVTVHLKSVTITGGQTTVNHVNINGGGIYNGGTLTITDGHITGNATVAQVVNNASILGNGGGIFNALNAALTITDTTVSGNSAGNAGGGVASGGNLTIEGSRFANNSAFNGGAIGLDAVSTATITDSELSVNTAANIGGAIVVANASLTLTDSLILNNSAGAQGGGIFNIRSENGTSTVTVNGSTFDGNTAATDGGALYNLAGIASIVGGKITGNSANYGGGISNNGGTLVVNGTHFEDNVAQAFGGGISTFAGANTTVSNATFSGNTAATGAGIWNDATLAVEATTLDGNVAVYVNDDYLYGGAVYNEGSLTLTNSTVSNNESPHGGGLTNNGGNVTISNVTFAGNKAAGLGGAILNYDSGTLTITSSTISQNQADVGGGLWNGSGVGAGNNIIAGNSARTADPDVHGAFNPDSIAHNLIGDVGSATGITNGTNGNIVGGQGNAVIDPKLGPLADNGGPTKTFALLDDSPAVDAGKNVNATSYDQRGVARVIDGDLDGTATIDLGAYEYQLQLKLLSPIDSTIDTTPTFRWSAIPGAERYDIWVNDLTTGQSGVIRNPNVTGAEYAPTGKLIVGHTYLWTVRAISSDGEGSWATHVRFTVTEPQDAAPPTLTGLPYGTLDATPTFEWSAVPGAVRYDIWVNDLTTGQSGIIRHTNVTTNSFTPTADLPAGHSYVWTVRAITEEWLAGHWAANDLFSITAAPTLQAPLTVAADAAPTFQWTAVAGAAMYDIWVNDLTTGKSGVIRKTDVTGTSFTPSTELPGGHRYLWTVRAIDASGATGGWAAHRSFSLTATLLSPVQPSIDATPTFKWTAVDGAATYEIWVNNQTTGQSKVVYATGLTETTFTATTPLTVGHVYIWTVRAVHANGAAGLWSAHQLFTVTSPQSAAPPSLASPDHSTDTTPTLRWSEITGAARYHVWVNDVTTGQIGVIYDTHVADASYTPTTPLIPGHTYVWTVRAFNENGAAGEWASAQRFTISKLGMPQLDAPESATSDTTPEFAWSAVAGAARYHLWVNDLTTGQSGVIYQTHLAGTRFTPTTPLVVGHRYVWTVRAFNGDGAPGDWAQNRTFTVTELSAPTLTSPGFTQINTQPTFAWQAVPGAAKYDVWVNDLTTGRSGVIRNPNVIGTSYTATTSLVAGHQYLWTVRAIRDDGSAGRWAAHQTFVVSAAPTIQSLTSTATQTTPTFQWSAVPGAVRYDLWVNDLTTGQAQVIRNRNIANTAFTPATPLKAGHRYIWTVRGIDANGQGGNWAPHATFTVTVAANSFAQSFSTGDSNEEKPPSSDMLPINGDEAEPTDPSETPEAADWIFAAWDRMEWWSAGDGDPRADETSDPVA